MPKKNLALIMLFAMVIAYIAYSYSIQSKGETSFMSLPSLPQPIAKEYVLITSAGQGTDAYILNDIANKLMIHNYFMPQANETDLEGINTVVFVVDYSPLGEKLNHVSFQEEKHRIAQLAKKSQQEQLTVITIFNGNQLKPGEENEELLKMIAPASDYLIGTKEANKDGILSDLAKASQIPITLVNDVTDFSEPFASAFR